jgi:hypothetical protein
VAITAEPEFDPACGTYISWSGGYSLPETFGAVVRDEDLPWRIRLRVFVERDGIAKCSSLTIEVPDVDAIVSGEWQPVTPAEFRRVRLSACLEAACLAAAMKIRPAPVAEVEMADVASTESGRRARPARPIRGRRTPDEFLRDVAHAYMAATQTTSRRRPRLAVEEWYRGQYHADVGKGVAGSWVNLCRGRIDPKTGTTFLPQTEPRKVSR